MTCLDASVVGKLICPDEEAFGALEKYEEALIAGGRFMAPHLLPFEIASILRKKQVRKLLSPSEILGAVHAFQGLKIQMVGWEGLLERSLSLCEIFRPHLTPYDASYLAVAEREKVALWTADKEFFKIVSPSFPDVEFISRSK